MEIFDQLTDQFRNAVLALFSFDYLLYLVGAVYAIYKFYSNKFNDHINYSLCDVRKGEDGEYSLKISTICKLPIDDVLPDNLFFKLQFLLAVKNSTKNKMFIKMQAKTMRIMHKAVVNAGSSLFGVDFVRKSFDLGNDLVEKELLLAVSYEEYDHYKGYHGKKIRVILISEDDLSYFINQKVHLPSMQVESKEHRVRINTLCHMADFWEKQNFRKTKGGVVRKMRVMVSK